MNIIKPIFHKGVRIDTYRIIKINHNTDLVGLKDGKTKILFDRSDFDNAVEIKAISELLQGFYYFVKENHIIINLEAYSSIFLNDTNDLICGKYKNKDATEVLVRGKQHFLINVLDEMDSFIENVEKDIKLKEVKSLVNSTMVRPKKTIDLYELLNRVKIPTEMEFAQIYIDIGFDNIHIEDIEDSLMDEFFSDFNDIPEVIKEVESFIKSKIDTKKVLELFNKNVEREYDE